ncbi:hydrolase [Undibacterium terreum]|uniref:Dienelactone hydrolase domain-containing protein n=1 Tax=Undibacterium terreum TaxID=1224302 RepID=A0A916U465_9BURK|nr:hydrolase [Undibacterium terreum]GGC58961.1 hypothetical protein GCM10011396_02330 [Undibacterium terreum]
MTVLIATDVFGITPAVHSLARSLGRKCRLVSPFSDIASAFYSEQKAYQAFLAEGGVARYAEKIQHLLKEQGSHIHFAIGFSAGASALWLGSTSPVFRHLQMMSLFYGSRIRDYTDIQPVCPSRLIFAEKEAAFEPGLLAAELKDKGHTVELVKNTAHGFMNPYSGGFCVKSQARYLAELSQMLDTEEASHGELA